MADGTDTGTQESVGTPAGQTAEQIAAGNDGGTPPALDISKYVNSDGTLKQGWKDGLVPQELRGNKFYDGNFFQDIPGLLKLAGHQATMIGKYSSTKGILPINEKSTPMEIEAYRESLGVPKDASGYKIPTSESLPIDPKYLTPILSEFNKTNFTQAQVDVALKAHENYMNTVKAEYDALMEQKTKDAIAKVESKWGQKFPQRQAMAKSFVTKMTGNFSPEEYEMLFGKEVEFQNSAGVMEKTREGGINSPEFAEIRPLLLDLFANIEEKYGIEDSATISDANSPEAKSIEDQIQELYKTPGFVDGKLRGSINPRDRERHQEILDKISALTRRLPPKPSIG